MEKLKIFKLIDELSWCWQLSEECNGETKLIKYNNCLSPCNIIIKSIKE
jgi:hypothetical protein